MFFDDWKTHKKETISKAILWEYNTDSADWSWQNMSKIVVSRVIERGREEDYYAMFQLYGGIDGVKEIVKKIPYMNSKDMNWCCVLFKLNKEDLWCYNRALSRQKLLSL